MVVHAQISETYTALGDFRVWSKGSATFRIDQLGKNTDPKSDRQAQFKAELRRLSLIEGATVPVFFEWLETGPMRMDKGCLGHALASGFITAAPNPEAGYLTHVTLSTGRAGI